MHGRPSLTTPDFLTGGGVMGALMRAHDWSATPLGPPEGWSQRLATLVGVMIASRQAKFIVWGPQRTLLYNDAYAEILGQKHPKALGRDFLAVWNEIRVDLIPIVEQAYAGDPVHMDDITLIMERHGYPEETHFAFSYTPVKDETGAVIGFYCPCTETTRQVKAERRLAAETERQRRLFQQAPGFITVLDGPTHVFEFVNLAYRRLFGDRDFIGKTAREAFPELEGQGIFERLDQVYASGQRFVANQLPVRLQFAPGVALEERFLDFIYEPVVDDAGRVTGIFCEGHDATEAHLAQQALRELNEDLEARVAERTAERDRVWRNSRDLLVIVDAEGIFQDVNPAFTAILGYAREEVVGRNYLDFTWPEDQGRSHERHAVASKRSDLDTFENRYRHKDGTPRWISWQTSAESDIVYGYGRDITAQKEQAEALRDAEEQLRQAQKMEAVGQLTGGIAHDFNNLLTGVLGSLDMLRTRIAQGRLDSVDRYVNAATASANRAAALTHRLLAFARRQPLDPKPVRANALVASLEDLFRRTVGEAVQFEVVLAGGLWPTLCDPNQLESALLNLVINARDAMPNGGKLTVETCNAHLDDAYVAAQRDVKPGQYVCICVTDTGLGMPPDVIERAFDPFFTTKPIGQGTGLGLSMVYGFAKQSEGHAKIYSEVRQGTTIKIYLPRYRGEIETEIEAAILAEAPRAESGETVLVVEDEPVVRSLIVEVLDDLGYRTLEAADGPEGLKILQSRRRIDLLITDVGLPGLNGRQLADAARERRRDLKVLFITGYAENATLAAGFLEHGMQMITKPFAVDGLAQKIRSILSGE